MHCVLGEAKLSMTPSDLWPLLWLVLLTPCVVIISLVLIMVLLRFLLVPLLNIDLLQPHQSHSVYCRLCQDLIRRRNWAQHRVECAKDHCNELEIWPKGLKTCVLDNCMISHRCPRCAAILRRLPVVDHREVEEDFCCWNSLKVAKEANGFICDNQNLCPLGEKIEVDGQNCITCFRCDIKLCHLCARNNFCLAKKQVMPGRCDLALINNGEVCGNELSVYEVINCSALTSPSHVSVQKHQPLHSNNLQQLRYTAMIEPSPTFEAQPEPLYSTYV